MVCGRDPDEAAVHGNDLACNTVVVRFSQQTRVLRPDSLRNAAVSPDFWDILGLSPPPKKSTTKSGGTTQSLGASVHTVQTPLITTSQARRPG